jgi:hypothetical protein
MLPRGSSDAALMLYHVDRSKLFVMDRLAKTKLLDACACRKSNPDIFVMQSAQNWMTKNVTDVLNGARYRRILM